MCFNRTKKTKLTLVLFLILCFPTNILTSPMYGGDKTNVAKELPSREKKSNLITVLLNVSEPLGLVTLTTEH